jgi:hypothetical protein
LSSQDGANSNGVIAAPMDRVEDVEDIIIASAAASDNAGCSNNCRARSGAGRYRCDSEVNNYEFLPGRGHGPAWDLGLPRAWACRGELPGAWPVCGVGLPRCLWRGLPRAWRRIRC